MISHISGRIKEKKESSVIMEAGYICYEVLLPPVVMKGIDSVKSEDGTVSLVVFHYYQMEPSRATPVLVGFLNEIEKEFFEQFITVSGVGPKAACRALTLSFAVIAEAIDKGDMALLKTLPGIGERKAREIIARLQGKVGKFGLIQDRGSAQHSSAKEDIKEDALNVLMQLQYKRNEAKDMVDKAVRRNPDAATCEEILNEIYKGSKRQING
ncbi:MAG: Holliday junction branch migration protein RuvA [Candidatus Omnitrophota bacterium]|jgi:Holliday junction DNA helicase RuvA